MPETTSQRAERLKREQNPWDELPRLFAAMRGGIGAIAPADLNARLRWWGLYTQGDGEGAFGDAAPYFMLRIRIPGGRLTAAQTAEIAALARQYGRSLADVTVRQNIQLHWLDAETLPDVFHRLWQAGLTSQSACGDDPRNLTGCPLASLDPSEICDASPLLAAANQALLSGGEFYNLPRKFKASISGCRDWCANPEINDVAFTARREPAPDGRPCFDLQVGGGLSTTPVLALRLPVSVSWNQVVPVTRAVASLFRDREELRQDRARARLKFLALRHGWTAERFIAEIERHLDFQLTRAEPDPPPSPGFRDHLGWHAQRQSGLAWAGLSVLRGRLTADQLDAVADTADRWGGDVRATAMQNLIVAGLPVEREAEVRAHFQRWGMPLAASSFRRGVMSCTGKEFCKLAVVETKSFAAGLVTDLERRLPDHDVPLRINLNGCPNSCGQHWVADIGLQGTRVKTAGGAEDGYDVFLGGGLGAGPTLARKTLARVRAADLSPTIEGLIRRFTAEHRDGESFRDFVGRTGMA